MPAKKYFTEEEKKAAILNNERKCKTVYILCEQCNVLIQQGYKNRHNHSHEHINNALKNCSEEEAEILNKITPLQSKKYKCLPCNKELTVQVRKYHEGTLKHVLNSAEYKLKQ